MLVNFDDRMVFQRDVAVSCAVSSLLMIMGALWLFFCSPSPTESNVNEAGLLYNTYIYICMVLLTLDADSVACLLL